VRVLIFHGYLLRGTGSNVYNASLAEALARLGHEVHLLCQDANANELPWVGGGRPRTRSGGGDRDGRPGSVTVHVPDIGGLLPVFVADRYEGFEVKTFPELTDAELDRYLDANVSAVRDVVAEVGAPDAALANHLIMGPAILARTGLEFAIKVHGSDLSYTVMPHPERFVPYAREGTDAAAGILVGSGHTARDLFETVPDSQLPGRTRLGPPGIDVEAFRPVQEAEALRRLGGLAEQLDGEAGDDSFGRDGPEAADAIRAWSQGSPRILFVGKLLKNKGLDLLLDAWPAVLEKNPDARLLLAGFGEYRLQVEKRIAALGTGAGSVSVSGRLEHAEVAVVDPAAEALVMPSTFPEAFGMVAVEAAACGALPVSADHSGMREVSQQLAGAVDPDVGRLLSFPVEEGGAAIAERLNAWLALPEATRQPAREALAARAAELWSWDKVANGVIAASRGELDDLVPISTA
jgi:glycosyltransferase involved in cell wall biosynthesis